jgi:hypothetical protein
MKEDQEDLDNIKSKIQRKGLAKISQYFDLDENKLADIDSDSIKHLFNMAKLGMQFEKEMNLTKRATEMNFIRISKLCMENKEEIKKYLKKTLPTYLQ